MTATDVAGRLAEHKTLGAAPPEELGWLASHGSLRQLAAVDVLTAKGAHVEGLFVVLSGRIAFFADRGAGPHKIMEWREGDVTGVPGVFAAGDLRASAMNRVASAVGEGSMVVRLTHGYLALT
jgi:CRP-like cAMP-binding protein